MDAKSDTFLVEDWAQRQQEATTVLAKAMNRLDASAVNDWLAPNVIYESQAVRKPLRGKHMVADYLTRKYDTVRDNGGSVVAELGAVDLPAAAGIPCVLCYQGGELGALFVVTLNAKGLIARIDIITAAPQTGEAKGTGVFPN